MTAKTLKVTLVKSLHGQLANIRNSARGLGLRHIAASARGLGLRHRHQSVQVADTPANRGMIRTAGHLLKVEPN